MKYVLIVLLTLILTLVSIYSRQFTDDQVDMSVIFPNLNLTGVTLGNQYTGYLPITPTRQLHYWFAATQNPNITPYNQSLVIWLNGGPGCSSLEGLFDENGPIYFSEMTPNGTYVANINNQSWNKFANMLYLETPAGVGFSTNNDNIPDDDTTVAANNVLALQYFLSFFGISKETKIYIAGESYAGIYVPYFAYAIHNNNLNSSNVKINFGGYFVGNPCTDLETNECGYNNTPFFNEYSQGQYEQLHNQQIISDDLFNNSINSCYYQPNQTQCDIDNFIINNNVTNYNYSDSGPWMNYYDVYRQCDLPVPNPTPPRKQNLKKPKIIGVRSVFDTQITPTPPQNNPSSNACVDGTGDFNFWNNRTLWPTLHINPAFYPSNWTWNGCTDLPNFTPTQTGSYWIYNQLINQGYKIGVFSGNTDFCVPITGTTVWVHRLVRENQLTSLSEKGPFYVPSTRYNKTGETIIGGMVEEFDSDFKFFIINGVGHMSVQWNRLAGNYLINNMLYDAKTALPLTEEEFISMQLLHKTLSKEIQQESQ